MASTYQQLDSSNRIVLSMETAEAKSDQRHRSNSGGSHTTKKVIVGMIFAGILLSALLVVNWSSSSNSIGEVSTQNAVSSSGDVVIGNIIQYEAVYHLQNGYASWSGGYLDTRGGGCEGNHLCVSTATSKNRDRNSGSWQIVSVTGRAGVVKNGDIVYLINQYPNGGYLDTRGGGCEGNYLCVSTASTGNRDNGSGKWKIDADPAVTYISKGTPFHLKNEYANGNGGYLDTRSRGCEGNDLCVSTSSTRLRGSGSTFWKFLDA